MQIYSHVNIQEPNVPYNNSKKAYFNRKLQKILYRKRYINVRTRAIEREETIRIKKTNKRAYFFLYIFFKKFQYCYEA